MNSILARMLGLALIVAAIAGLFFSGWGMVRIWAIKKPVTRDVLETVVLAQTALEVTSDGLLVAEASLDKAMVDVIALKDTLETTGKAIRGSNPIFISLSNLLENDLPETIGATQTSLESAQVSAEVIDSFLRTISSIPFLPIQPYDPPVPLHESLAEVADSLDGIPEVLIGMGEDLGESRGNLLVIQAEFRIMAQQVEKINESLAEAQTVVIDYQEVVTELQDRMSNLESNIPERVDRLVWFLTVALIWLAITQLGLLAQGVQMMRVHRDAQRVEPPGVEKLVEREEEEPERENDNGETY